MIVWFSVASSSPFLGQNHNPFHYIMMNFLDFTIVCKMCQELYTFSGTLPGAQANK